MTKFEDLLEIISRNKNKGKMSVKTVFTEDKEDNDVELEVSGSESTRAPLVVAADDQLDPDLIDILYTKARHKPKMDLVYQAGTLIIKKILNKTALHLEYRC
jgi:hypothetical protein